MRMKLYQVYSVGGQAYQVEAENMTEARESVLIRLKERCERGNFEDKIESIRFVSSYEVFTR